MEGLERNCLYGLTGIREIAFSESLICVQPSAISNCDVEKLIFRKNLKNIDTENLRTNKNLRCIEIEDGNKYYTNLHGNLYSADMNSLIYGFNNHIADTTRWIERNSFTDSNIKSIKFPESVTNIGDSAFLRCERLKDVLFSGSNVVTIGEGAFEQCKSLKRIVLPESVQIIGYAAFRQSGLKELRFADRNEDSPNLQIDMYAFMNTNIKIVDFSKVNHLVIEEEAFMSANVKSLSLRGNVYLDDYAFGGCSIENLTLKSINVDIPTLKGRCEALGNNSRELINIISKYNNTIAEVSYLLHQNHWIENRYW